MHKHNQPKHLHSFRFVFKCMDEFVTRNISEMLILIALIFITLSSLDFTFSIIRWWKYWGRLYFYVGRKQLNIFRKSVYAWVYSYIFPMWLSHIPFSHSQWISVDDLSWKIMCRITTRDKELGKRKDSSRLSLHTTRI